jgi:hypothetical protein
MTYTQPQTFPDSDYFQPQPQQDSELLRQIGFIPGLKELLMLRQVHALEHGTIWVLSEGNNNENLGGLSTDQGFYIYGQVNQDNLHQAVRRALERLQTGEWNLAVHPRCGTNLSVAMVLTTGLALGSYLILPRNPLSQIFGLGIAAATAMEIAPEIGLSAQRYLTTAIPFNLRLVRIAATKDFWGRQAYFVRVRWEEV